MHYHAVPLTADDLHRIQERYRRSLAPPACGLEVAVVWRDVVALLYEIKRVILLVNCDNAIEAVLAQTASRCPDDW